MFCSNFVSFLRNCLNLVCSIVGNLRVYHSVTYIYDNSVSDPGVPRMGMQINKTSCCFIGLNRICCFYSSYLSIFLSFNIVTRLFTLFKLGVYIVDT